MAHFYASSPDDAITRSSSWSSFSSSYSNSSAKTVWYDCVDSTMDRAKDYIKELKENDDKFINKIEAPDEDYFVIMAGEQSAGRGTNGRVWNSTAGNLFMTVGFKTSLISTPLQLTPLRIGTLIAPIISKYVNPSNVNQAEVKLKWPNDILVNKKKISGILIEIQNDYFLIGIGCNVLYAPEIQSTGTDSGRKATCIADYCMKDVLNMNSSKTIANDLGTHIADSVYKWVYDNHNDAGEFIVNDFSMQMDYSPKKLRDSQSSGTVTPLRVNPDGTLRVTTEAGLTKDLTTDYLF